LAEKLDIHPSACLCVWSIFEVESMRYSPSVLFGDVEMVLRREWKKIDLKVIQKCIDEFPKRFWSCIKAGGGHFENT
jgi:hypothetical protein